MSAYKRFNLPQGLLLQVLAILLCAASISAQESYPTEYPQANESPAYYETQEEVYEPEYSPTPEPSNSTGEEYVYEYSPEPSPEPSYEATYESYQEAEEAYTEEYPEHYSEEYSGNYAGEYAEEYNEEFNQEAATEPEYTASPAPSATPSPEATSYYTPGTTETVIAQEGEEAPSNEPVENTEASPECDLAAHLMTPAFTSPPGNFLYARLYSGEGPSYSDGVARNTLSLNLDLNNHDPMMPDEIVFGSAAGSWGIQVSGDCKSVSYGHVDGEEIAGIEAISKSIRTFRESEEGVVEVDSIRDEQRIATGFIDPEGGGSMPLETTEKVEFNGYQRDSKWAGPDTYKESWKRFKDKKERRYEGYRSYLSSRNKTEIEWGRFVGQTPNQPQRVFGEHINFTRYDSESCDFSQEESYSFSLRNLNVALLKDSPIHYSGNDQLLESIFATGAVLSSYSRTFTQGERIKDYCRTTLEIVYELRPVQGLERKKERIWNNGAQAYDEFEWTRAAGGEWTLVSKIEHENQPLL